MSVGPQALYGKHATDSRFVATAEILALGSPGAEWFDVEDGKHPKVPQFGVPIGWSTAFNTSSFAHGPSARLVFPIRRFDTQAGFVGGYRWYMDGKASDSGWHYGGQVEMGFGFAFVGLGIERDQVLTPAGSLEPVTALTTTLTLGAPVNRILPRLFRR